jgi:hypothetical protein
MEGSQRTDFGADKSEWLAEFRRPFEIAAVKFKGQSADREGSKALVVAYIDARLVIERLNAVAEFDWYDSYEAIKDGGGKTVAMWCHLTVGGQTRSDVGSGYQGKGLVSDALKRAAVKFGIGVSIYASPSIWLAKGNHCDIRVDGNRKSIYLKDPGIDHCRERYRQWLEDAQEEFGEPLGHGDVAGAAGLEGDETGDTGGGETAGPGSAPALLVDVEADTLRATCRTIFEEIRGLRGGRTKLPPARFQERLVEVSASHDQLREYAAELRTIVDELKGQG